MNWLTIIWCMAASASLTLASLHFIVWCKDRQSCVHLLFFIAALGVAGIAAGELMIMLSTTPQEYGDRLRWIHVPIFATVVSIVWFVRLYFRAGRLSLAWSICGIRALCLILNFAYSPNFNFDQITGIRHVPVFGGATISLAEGVASQRTRIGELVSLLLLIYVLDASITLWRRGNRHDRQRAIIVGGSICLFVLAAAGHVSLIHAGIIHFPYMISFAFLVPVIAMGYELGSDVVRAARLARELAESQHELRENRQQMELAVSAAAIGLWRWDVARDELWVNDRAGALLNLNGNQQKLNLRNFLDSMAGEDRDSLQRAVENALRTGTQHEGEYRIRSSNGTAGPRWIGVRGRAQLNGGAPHAVMHGIAFDVTSRRQADERFRALVEASPHALVVADSRGTIVLVNAQSEATFGCSREQLVGQPIDLLFPEPFRSVFRNRLQRLWSAPADERWPEQDREPIGLRKDGTEFLVDVRLNPVRTSEGEFAIASIVDATERKNAERERLRQRTELAHLSRIAMLGELSGSLAHELNQPLTAILSNAQAALEFLNQDSKDVLEVRGILNDIIDADRRAGEVIRRLRLLFRKGETQYEELYLNEIVLDVLRLINSELINHGVSVDTLLASNLPPVNGDRVQLQQVLINIMINASDAMDETDYADRRLRISTFVDADEERVHLTIADRGSGIADDQLERVFEPFHTTKATGMGLGLAVCRTIVSAHGGKIWATNNSDHGACFHIVFPSGVLV